MSVLSSTQRLRIMGYVQRQKNAIVSDIAEAMGISIPATSQHLRTLRLAGIVESTKRGVFRSYRLTIRQHPIVRKVLMEL